MSPLSSLCFLEYSEKLVLLVPVPPDSLFLLLLLSEAGVDLRRGWLREEEDFGGVRWWEEEVETGVCGGESPWFCDLSSLSSLSSNLETSSDGFRPLERRCGILSTDLARPRLSSAFCLAAGLGMAGSSFSLSWCHPLRRELFQAPSDTLELRLWMIGLCSYFGAVMALRN